MAILNFFTKKSKPGCVALHKKLQADAEHRKKISEQLAALEKIATTLDHRQKEMIIQLEELDAFISEGSEGHFEPLMALSDIIFDFYCYSKKDANIAAQARMMWQGAAAALKKAGIEVLAPTGENFSYCLHIAHGTTSEPDIGHECISETLKCGYVFGDKILRRATVMVNRANGGKPE